MSVGGKRAGAGKPRLDPDDKIVIVQIKMPAALAESATKAAQRAGLKRSAWIRRVLEEAALQ